MRLIQGMNWFWNEESRTKTMICPVWIIWKKDTFGWVQTQRRESIIQFYKWIELLRDEHVDTSFTIIQDFLYIKVGLNLKLDQIHVCHIYMCLWIQLLIQESGIASIHRDIYLNSRNKELYTKSENHECILGKLSPSMCEMHLILEYFYRLPEVLDVQVGHHGSQTFPAESLPP